MEPAKKSNFKQQTLDGFLKQGQKQVYIAMPKPKNQTTSSNDEEAKIDRTEQGKQHSDEQNLE